MYLENAKELLRRVSGKWTLAILAELAQAREGLGYCRLMAAVNTRATAGSIATQQMSKALKTLMERDLVACRGREGEYVLTEQGRALVRLLRELDAVYARMRAEGERRVRAGALLELVAA